jgi:hypothetical protein
MWLNITRSHARSPCTQNSFSIRDALDACERELGPLIGRAADVSGERTPLFKHSSRELKRKTSQATQATCDEREQIARSSLGVGKGKASTSDTAPIDWTIPIRLPSGTPMETWTSIPTSSRSITGSRYASNHFESRAGVVQLESTDFFTPFRRSVHRLSRQPLRALHAPTTHIMPFLMLPFGFWVALGLLLTWR